VFVRMHVRLMAILLVSNCFLFSLQFAGAQSIRGAMVGEVSDPSGAVVSNVKIKLVEIRTNQEHTAKTDETGFYTIINLLPGSYSLTVEFKGFKRFVQEGIQLATGEKIRVDAKLTVGDIRETVTVTNDAPLLRTETGGLGQVIDNQKIVDLPLNGRTFISLIGLSSGVALPPGSTPAMTFPRINGGRPRVNEYLFDGISVLQPEPGTVPFFPIIDAIVACRLSNAARFRSTRVAASTPTIRSGFTAMERTAAASTRLWPSCGMRSRLTPSPARMKVSRVNSAKANSPGVTTVSGIRLKRTISTKRIRECKRLNTFRKTYRLTPTINDSKRHT